MTLVEKWLLLKKKLILLSCAHNHLSSHLSYHLSSYLLTHLSTYLISQLISSVNSSLISSPISSNISHFISHLISLFNSCLISVFIYTILAISIYPKKKKVHLLTRNVKITAYKQLNTWYGLPEPQSRHSSFWPWICKGNGGTLAWYGARPFLSNPCHFRFEQTNFIWPPFLND